MLVDDEKPILDSLLRNLKKQGYHIDTFTSSVKALDHCSQEKYDLVISDYKMPDIDGVMFLSLVKNIQPDSVRFLLTSHAEAEQLIDAIDKSYVHKFILKPWDPAELRFLIANHLSEVVADKNE